jgi:hypothetical protein
MLYRMPGRPWFKALRKGFPAQPLTWEGWVFTGAYVAGLASFAHAARVLPPYTQPPLVASFVIAVALLSGFFLVFCWFKSELPTELVDRPKAKVEIMQQQDKRKPPSPWI